MRNYSNFFTSAEEMNEGKIQNAGYGTNSAVFAGESALIPEEIEKH